MEYLTITQTAEKWGLKGRWVTTLCSEGRIPGARKFGNVWMIPEDAEKPKDARVKSGNYIGFSQRHRKSKPHILDNEEELQKSTDSERDEEKGIIYG